jgi:hypothetical protein
LAQKMDDCPGGIQSAFYGTNRVNTLSIICKRFSIDKCTDARCQYISCKTNNYADTPIHLLLDCPAYIQPRLELIKALFTHNPLSKLLSPLKPYKNTQILPNILPENARLLLFNILMGNIPTITPNLNPTSKIKKKLVKIAEHILPGLQSFYQSIMSTRSILFSSFPSFVI